MSLKRKGREATIQKNDLIRCGNGLKSNTDHGREHLAKRTMEGVFSQEENLASGS